MLIAALLKLTIACGLLIPINSGHRTVEQNRLVGGAPNSKHLTAQAFDLGLHSFNAKEKQCLYREVKNIDGRYVLYPNHLHIDTRLP